MWETQPQVGCVCERWFVCLEFPNEISHLRIWFWFGLRAQLRFCQNTNVSSERFQRWIQRSLLFLMVATGVSQCKYEHNIRSIEIRSALFILIYWRTACKLGYEPCISRVVFHALTSAEPHAFMPDFCRLYTIQSNKLTDFVMASLGSSLLFYFRVSYCREDPSHCKCVVSVLSCLRPWTVNILNVLLACHICSIVANPSDFTPLRLLFYITLTGWVFEIVSHFRKAKNEITFS